MEITETLDDLGKKFERWHTDKYNTLHYNTIQSIESLANTTIEETDLIKLKILDIANLISVKLDGNRTNITNINDINTILNKIEATSDSINLKDFNTRLNEIQTLKTLIGNNTSPSNASIFERLATLESANLSTENVNNQIFSFFTGTDIVANDDLNDFKTAGVFKCPSNATVRTLSNCPTENAFNLIVLEHASNSVRQILCTHNTSGDVNKIWTRNYYNYETSWSNWTEIYGEHNTTKLEMNVEFSNGTTKTYTILTTSG